MLEAAIMSQVMFSFLALLVTAKPNVLRRVVSKTREALQTNFIVMSALSSEAEVEENE